MPGNALIGNLAVNLTMETAAFQRGATIAEKRAAGLRNKVSALSGTFKTFAVGFAGGIAAGLVPAISGVVTSAFGMAAALAEASDKVGVTVEALQELRLAATQNGISNEQLDTSLTRMNRTLGQLQLGSKSAVTAYARIGLSADELKGKKPEEAIRLIADGLNRIPDASIRAAVGQEIFGRGFAVMLPLINGGSAALDKYSEASRKAGQISTEDAQKLDELSDKWDKLKVTVGVATVNILGSFARGSDGVTVFIKNFWTARDEIIASFHAMRDRVVQSVSDMVAGIGNAITGRLSAIWEGAKAKVQGFVDTVKGMWDAVVGHSYIPDMVTAIGYEMGPRLQALMVAPATETIRKTGAAFAGGATEMADTVKRSTAEVIEGFGAMAAGTIGSVRSMVDTFKSGDILGAIQQFLNLVLNVVQALGQLGVIKLPTTTPPYGGARAHGGPVSPGKSYLVGENGPEVVSFGRRGYVNPNRGNSGQMRVIVEPSPYFDVRVDNRAGRVAGPMVGQGVVAAVGGGELRMARRQRRAIP